MSKEVEEEKRCLFCGKRLIDEKIHVCLRCKMKGRDTAGNVAGVIGSLVVAVGGGSAPRSHL